MKRLFLFCAAAGLAILLAACSTTRMTQTTPQVTTTETKTFDEAGRVKSVTTESVTLPGEIAMERVAFNLNPALQLQLFTFDTSQTAAGESIENANLVTGKDQGEVSVDDQSSTAVPVDPEVQDQPAENPTE